MSGPLGSSQWMYSSDAGFYPYSIDQSLRYNSADTLAMKRTPASAGNRQTWSVSFWLKRGKLGVSQVQLLEAGSSGGYSSRLFWFFDSNDKLVLSDGNTNYGGGNQVFRDVGAWYHILIRCTGGSVTHYVNGLLDKTQALAGDTAINSTVQHGFGTRGASGAGDEFDGYLAQYALFDGTAYTYDQVTETINGILVPKDLSALSYGTNGFLLDFANSGAVGTDAVGSNDMDTVSGFVASDVVPDSPTNNFAVFNALHPDGDGLSEGNLKNYYAASSGSIHRGIGTIAIPSSGKWYWELLSNSTDNEVAIFAYGIGKAGTYNTSGVANGSVLSFEADADAGTLTIYDDESQVSQTTSIDFSKEYTAYVGNDSTNTSTNSIANFGQDSTFAGNKTAGGNADANGVGDFFYAPSSGFLALCTANLPEPTIGPNSTTTSDEHFDTLLYTGTGSTGLEVNGLSFTPDWLWIKRRDSAQNFSNAFVDSVRGNTKNLISNRTDAESTSTGTNDVQSFDSDGFTVGPSNQVSVNDSGGTFVAWCWKAGTSVSGTTTGSGTGQAYTGSVNTDAGFSIIAYTGNGTAGHTIPHHLGVAPKMVISKKRSSTGSWGTYHDGLTSASYYILLNDSAAQASNTVYFNGTAPTDTVVTRGTGADGNANGVTYVQYAFAEIDGYSRITSYVGNASTDGTFCHLGHRPAWIMLKNASASGAWYIFDVKRNTYNAMDKYLRPNLSNAEGTLDFCDFTSNGFKIRSSAAEWNGSGNTIIVLSFAEQPFKYANAR